MALENLREICEKHIKSRYNIEVIDLLKHPELSKDEQILAIPSFERKLPRPTKRIIGDLTAKERVMLGLDIIPAEQSSIGS